MSKKTISWKEKMENPKDSQIKDTPKGKMYISTPKEIYEIIKNIPDGKLISTKYISRILKEKYKVDYVCPLTTGIFVSICANASEAERDHEKIIPPYWRVIKPNGKIYEKYLGKILPQEEILEKEGFWIVDGKVKDYKKYLLD